MRKNNVVILKLEMVVTVRVSAEAFPRRMSAPQGAHYHADVIYLLP